ncbi:MAG TPA: Asp-tRNA(Asn)/Glu-tRNA(Gln) amidotransferase GatCAB subunit B, partial [Gemmataceae bacterium]
LAPIVVDAAWLERARAAMGELPSVQRVRLVEQYGLSPYDAGVLTLQGRALVAYFEDVARRSGDARAACNWVANQVLATLKERKIDITDFPLTSERLAELIAQQKAIGLNRQMAGEVYNRMLESGCGAKQAMDALGIKPTDTGALAEIVRRALAANPKAVADFKAGKTKAAQAIKGAVMRETKGTARPEVVEQLILEEIQKTP